VTTSAASDALTGEHARRRAAELLHEVRPSVARVNALSFRNRARLVREHTRGLTIGRVIRWIGVGGLSDRARMRRRAVERARARARLRCGFYCLLFPFEPCASSGTDRFWVSFVRSERRGLTMTISFFSRRVNTAQDWGCETGDRCVEVFVRARTRAGGSTLWVRGAAGRGETPVERIARRGASGDGAARARVVE
jgi:hypothetical protein